MQNLIGLKGCENHMNHQLKTKKGIVEGIKCDGYVVYKGIPYGKPPVGELRFREPQELESWEGVLKADKFKNITPQDFPDPNHPIMGRFVKEFYSNTEFIPQMNEDCLYLNIWVPENTSGGNLPVAFWLHGGGFSGGYSSELEFDGEAYCKKGVILVTVEYRCNIFGFLAHPWLTEESEKGISGNYGIMDQIAALKWVYENIEGFGGNPNNITVFGQSAGSMSTQVLVSSELTEGMIAHAIMQSGISCEEEILLTPTLAEAEEFGKLFVEECAGVKSLEELRAMTTEEIAIARRLYDSMMWQSGTGLSLVPNVDGYVLNESVKEIYKKGKMKKIPYMLGTVVDDLGATRREVKEKKTGILMEECKRFSYQCEKEHGAPAYLYYFNHELPGDDWGAFHSSELWYMFGTLKRCWRSMTEKDYKLSDRMVTAWANFMKDGVPGVDEAGEWKPCGKESSFIKTFGEE